MTTMPLSEVKAHLSELADEIHRTHDRVNVTRNGRDYVVILSAEDLESMEATLELLTDQPAVTRILAAREAVERGDVTTRDEMTRLMQERRRSGR